MDRNKFARVACEQAVLTKELAALTAQQHAVESALQQLCWGPSSERPSDLLESGSSLLRSLHGAELQLRKIVERLADLRQCKSH